MRSAAIEADDRVPCRPGVKGGWSIKKFVRTARRYRTVKIQAGNQTLTAALIRVRTDGVH
ncbi:hypothetical protein [Mycolicibacterium moriokaense]|uniref:Uncharacterized protein n=1 Tax=Mycolicibacterium moriokaense TaxID=39691 RepID=A0A318H6V8_9MYCO|nr:hypothetical protein [Mycolicibacterium moriokaense]PXW99854.1 hypothetical protein C8E89_13910 [Mycolicibacterium moriokaense]